MGKKVRRYRQISFTILIATAVVLFWRGVWGLLDVYLYPKDHIISLWISVALGVAILVGTHKLVKELV